jgi:hypothetical protein
MCELILKKCEGYGNSETPITMSIFKSIIKDALEEQKNTLLNI